MAMGQIAVVAGVQIIGGIMSNSAANKNLEQADKQFTETQRVQNEQIAKLDAQKKEYSNMEFKNPFSDMENVYEDLTVNQQQADFQSQQGAQSRANIMQGLKGAAGSSGIAGLAQSLANQGSLQTQQISASIGLQESQNQIASAKGAGAVQIAERQGDQWVAQQEADRQATLLGMQMGQTTGANLAASQAQANQVNAGIASQQTTASTMSNLAQIAAKIDVTKPSTTTPTTTTL